MIRRVLLLLGAATVHTVVWAEEKLLFPVDCTLGGDCFIQQYVDRDPGPGVADFACGGLTYDGHRGTDIRLRHDGETAQGVKVIASAAGRVLGIRDNVPDQRQGTPGAPDIKGRECGNGVLIETASGWRHQYCHLQRGSVVVRKGQTVAAGDILGEVGLSGMTQFPHLHLTIRDPDRTVIDPFDARAQARGCALPDTETLWADPAVAQYRPGAPLDAGFADRIPAYESINTGAVHQSEPDAGAAALVFWTHFYGLRLGDELRLTLAGPDGSVVAEATHRMQRNRATEFRAVGRKARGAWAKGTYTGRAEMLRDGKILGILSRTLQIGPAG